MFYFLCALPPPCFCLFALVSELGYCCVVPGVWVTVLSLTPAGQVHGCPFASSVSRCHHTGLACFQDSFMLQYVLTVLSVYDWNIICYVESASDLFISLLRGFDCFPFWPLWTVMLLWMLVCGFVWAYVFSSLRLKPELLELFSWLNLFQNCICNTPHNRIYVDHSFAMSSRPSFRLLLSLQVWNGILA